MARMGKCGVEDLCDLIRSEYLEMPGLCLTAPQVGKLWNLDRSLCEMVVGRLLSEGFLRQNRNRELVLRDTFKHRAAQRPTGGDGRPLNSR
jgi:hypothetical protein